MNTPEQDALDKGYSPEQANVLGGLERLLSDVPVHVSIPLLIVAVATLGGELETVPARFQVASMLRDAAQRLEDIGRLPKEPASDTAAPSAEQHHPV